MALAPAATLPARIPEQITAVLRAHGAPASLVDEETRRMRDWRLGPTANRSVVGIMNEFTHLAEAWRCDQPQPELVEQERRKALAQLAELRSRPVAKQRMRWVVADTYRGIERALLVVINIRDHTDRDKGEALLAEVARLRKDDAVFTDVMGPHGNRVPITAVVANLAKPTDPGTKKALARVRRVIRAEL